MDLKVLRRQDLSEKVCVVIGTRPSLVKQSPVIRELQRRSIPFALVHTGQHYSYEMDRIFLEELELPVPDHHLDGVGSHTLHGAQTAAMLVGIEQALLAEKPGVVLVGGDANSNLAGALASRKLNIPLCHDEAGLRSGDWLMPEEHNRIMIDHISEYLLAPNAGAAETLRTERVRGEIVITGSTIVDAVQENYALAQRRSDILDKSAVDENSYVLMTIHHEETVDYPETLESVLIGAAGVASSLGLPVLLPAHPRTQKRLVEFNLLDMVGDGTPIRMLPPQGYFDFLRLLGGARLVMTESGGVIQEACVLRVPCVTLGSATEWVETVEAGANVVAGVDPDQIEAAALKAHAFPRTWTNPFGDFAAKRVVDVLEGVVRAGP